MKVKGKKKNSRWKKWIQQKRMKNQRKYWMEKPSLKKIAIKNIAVGLCVAILICYYGSLLAVSEFKDQVEDDYELVCANVQRKLTDSYYKTMNEEVYGDRMEAIKATWQYQFAATGIPFGNDFAMALYDLETKELIVESEEMLSVIVVERLNTEKRKSGIFNCSYEVMQEALEFYDENESYSDTVSITVEDVYVKDGTFVPGRVVISEGEYEEETVLKEYDYTPDDKAGYIHIEKESHAILGPIYWDICGSVEMKETLHDYMDNGINEDNMWEYANYFYSYDSFWGKTFFGQEELMIDDWEVKLVLTAKRDMFDLYGIWIVLAYAGILLFVLLIAFGLTYRSYMVRLNHYQLDEYRRQTTNAMAHDLKTPLMAISGYADNLRANVHTEKKDYYADVILENVQYMNQMIGNILELAKVENVRWVPDKEDVDLKSMTEDILKQYEILTTDKKVLVDLEGEATIQADKTLMTQALRNLISNAMKYAIKGSVIHIQMNHESFEIRNEMQGELEVSVEELWKPFVKGDNSRNEQKGTGIGLTIVKNITDVHGFELVLQSEEKEFIAQIWM